MKLYHYNEKPLDILISLYGRGLNSEDKKRLGDYVNETKDPYAYIKNLSFFLEPIPRNLPEILHNEHSFWTSGKELYQHIVDTSVFSRDVPYRLVESPEKTDLIYNKQNWTLAEKNPELATEYKRQITELEKELLLTGRGIYDLVKVASRYKGITEYYKKAYKLHKKFPEDNIISKYAACVPHLMVYTAMDKVKVSKINEFILE